MVSKISYYQTESLKVSFTLKRSKLSLSIEALRRRLVFFFKFIKFRRNLTIMVQAPVTIPVQFSILSFDFHHKDLNIIRLFKLWIKHFKTFKVPIPLIQCYAPQKLNLDLIFSNLPALCPSPSLPNYFWSISELFAQFFAKSAHPCNIPFYFFSLKTGAHEKGIWF